MHFFRLLSSRKWAGRCCHCVSAWHCITLYHFLISYDFHLDTRCGNFFLHTLLVVHMMDHACPEEAPRSPPSAMRTGQTIAYQPGTQPPRPGSILLSLLLRSDRMGSGSGRSVCSFVVGGRGILLCSCLRSRYARRLFCAVP